MRVESEHGVTFNTGGILGPWFEDIVEIMDVEAWNNMQKGAPSSHYWLPDGTRRFNGVSVERHTRSAIRLYPGDAIEHVFVFDAVRVGKYRVNAQVRSVYEKEKLPAFEVEPPPPPGTMRLIDPYRTVDVLVSSVDLFETEPIGFTFEVV
ncbi:MAG: hypothetical protein N3A38_13255, partial [Planctomycetota bacterium]|nr:hypothetical protein [Planctomycetota bacterium]